MSTITKEKKYILQTYGRYDLVVAKAKGKYLWDNKGKKYLDFFSGISTANLGHGDKKILSAVRKQSEKYMHVSNYYYAEPQVKLAEKLINLTFPGKVFLSNSGAEANECAIKLVRKYGSEKGRYEMIAFKNSFHGRTIATLSSTGQKKFHKGFEPMLKGFRFAEFNDINSVKKLLNKKTAGVLIELVQGEGGINIAEKGFARELKKLCDKNKLLLVVDEIQTGIGRTGKAFAYEHYGIKPNIVTLAKSLGGGLPLGATIIDNTLASVLSYGEHGSTFGGNPVSCAAALEVLRSLTPALLNKVKANGNYFIDKLDLLKKKWSFIKEVRGVGLMVGVELALRGADIVKFCQAKGLLINCTNNTVLRFLPPLIIGKADIDKAVKILEEAFKWQSLKK